MGREQLVRKYVAQSCDRTIKEVWGAVLGVGLGQGSPATFWRGDKLDASVTASKKRIQMYAEHMKTIKATLMHFCFILCLCMVFHPL